MMSLLSAAVWGILSWCLVVQDPQLRTWVDDTGQHRIEAEFVELKGINVSLKLEDGRVIQVSLDKLSPDDRAFARQAAKAAREAKKTVVPTSAASEVDLTQATSTDWPQWRGPNRDGISTETGLLKTWPAGGPPEAYRCDGLGEGYSSVAISNGRVFTMGKFGDETRLLALNVENGEILWQTPVGRGGDLPNCTPTVDGDLVFAVSRVGDLLCAESATGREVWRKNFSNDFGGQMMSGWGYSESPLVDGDRLIVTPGAKNAIMAALEKRTGKPIWRASLPANPGPAGTEGAGYSSIVISQARGVKQYVQLVGQGVISVDADTGKFLWGYNRIANTTANIPTPIVSGDFVFCSTGYGDGGSALIQVTGSRGQLSMREVWYKPSHDLQNHHGGMILVGDHVYMGHGHSKGFPVCFDLKTGEDKWRPGRGAGAGSAAIAYADGRFYFRYENGVMALIDATLDDYFERGQFQIGIKHKESWPHPVISDGKLYLRDQHEMIVYDIRQH